MPTPPQIRTTTNSPSPDLAGSCRIWFGERGSTSNPNMKSTHRYRIYIYTDEFRYIDIVKHIHINQIAVCINEIFTHSHLLIPVSITGVGTFGTARIEVGHFETPGPNLRNQEGMNHGAGPFRKVRRTPQASSLEDCLL